MMKAAARVLDPHTCPLSAPVPHVGGVVQGPGVTTVLIGSQPAATQGSGCTCALGMPNVVVGGSSTVVIGYKAAARVGDATAHGGRLEGGCTTVVVGG